MRYRYYHDPAHGFVEVLLSELIDLGITDQISKYSYQGGAYAWLEEDQDVYTWMQAHRAQDPNWAPEFKHLYTGYHFIRNMERYGTPNPNLFIVRVA